MKHLAAAALLGLSACASTQAEPITRESVSAERCVLTASTAQLRLIDTAAAWKKALPPDGVSPLSVEPDWASERILILSNGPRPTPGYRLSLQSESLDGSVLELHIQESAPQPGAMLAQVMTQPCLFIRLGKQGWRSVRVQGTHTPLSLPAR